MNVRGFLGIRTDVHQGGQNESESFSVASSSTIWTTRTRTMRPAETPERTHSPCSRCLAAAVKRHQGKLLASLFIVEG